MADCYLCGKRAVFRTEAGPLCAGHFSKWYEDGVANAISRYSMVNPGDRICVGFSGVKDSTVLLAALCRLNLDAELVAVNAEIRDHAIEVVGRKLRAYMTAMKAII
mgnify:CR=1 FL=1